MCIYCVYVHLSLMIILEVTSQLPNSGLFIFILLIKTINMTWLNYLNHWINSLAECILTPFSLTPTLWPHILRALHDPSSPASSMALLLAHSKVNAFTHSSVPSSLKLPPLPLLPTFSLCPRCLRIHCPPHIPSFYSHSSHDRKCFPQ